MKLKRLVFLFSIFVLLLGACSNTSSNTAGEGVAEGKGLNTTAESVSVEELEKQATENMEKIEILIKSGELNEVKKLLDDELLGIGDDAETVKSYITFLESNEPMSLRTAKLMDSVDYGYSGILSNEIEEAIYTPHEEGSMAVDTGREGFDYIDWKYNENKDKYEVHSNYHGLTIRAEMEKDIQEKLIEEAKDKNPTLGMTTAEVEASLWGKPEKINRRVSEYGVREQWVYGQGQYLYFEDGILTSFRD